MTSVKSKGKAAKVPAAGRTRAGSTKRAAAKDVAGSLRALGKALGRSHTSVIRASKREDWPFVLPYPVAAARKWFAENVPPDTAAAVKAAERGDVRNPHGGGRPAANRPLTETQRVKLELLKEELEEKRRESEAFRRQWHRVDECEDRQVAKVLAVKNALLTLPDGGLVERMLLASGEEAKAMLRGRLTEICQEFARGGNHSR